MTNRQVRPAPAVLATIAMLCVVAGVAACGSSSDPSDGGASRPTTATGSGELGTVIHHPVPLTLRRLPLTNQHGQHLTLNAWPGTTVLLVPFLTLCQDVCPLITGNLLAVEQSLKADHAAGKVEIVELTIDPHRDTPARLAAYANLTHADWQLVTESPSTLHKLSKFFGFYFKKIAEEDPDARDWWTGKPLTYDVDHTDNYFVIDPSGVERVVQDAAPDFHGKLNPKLYKFLDVLGRRHLNHPAQPDWTPTAVLNALAISVGMPLRPAELH